MGQPTQRATHYEQTLVSLQKKLTANAEGGKPKAVIIEGG